MKGLVYSTVAPCFYNKNTIFTIIILNRKQCNDWQALDTFLKQETGPLLLCYFFLLLLIFPHRNI